MIFGSVDSNFLGNVLAPYIGLQLVNNERMAASTDDPEERAAHLSRANELSSRLRAYYLARGFLRSGYGR